ncbi:MAG TPA: class I SAM-dependent methyltransferase [Candidatus Thermoplasmatota archaeon]
MGREPQRAPSSPRLDGDRLLAELEGAAKLPWRDGRSRLRELAGSLGRFRTGGRPPILVTEAVFGAELMQAVESRTEDRYRHYLRTLERSLREAAHSAVSDINLRRWKEHEDILTESLWIFPRRDGGGAHSAEYHGNFIPQIPNQVIRRFSKPGELVLDLFAGLGTTLIEARRLGRPCIGVELDPAVAEAAREALDREGGQGGPASVLLVGDSSLPATLKAIRRQMRGLGRAGAQLILLHPPYHDIVPFSGLPGDLSAAASVEEFLRRMEAVLRMAWELLDPGRFLVVVIGDKYERGRWVPLGFRTMHRAERCGFTLKSVVVKNMEGNRAKRGTQRLWARRAIAGNFYIFKHEYVFLFEKPRDTPRQLSLTDLPGRAAPRRRSSVRRRAGRRGARRARGASGTSGRGRTRRA